MQRYHLKEKIGTADDIPPLPALATKIIDGCINDQINFQQMAELIRHDLALTSKVLSLINSSFYSLYKHIDDLTHAISLLGMLSFGNLLKESGVTERLAETARHSFIDVVTILLGVTVGASTQADVFLTIRSVHIFALGAASFAIATAGGVLFAIRSQT